MNQPKNKLAIEELKFLASYKLKLQKISNPKIRKELEGTFLKLVGDDSELLDNFIQKNGSENKVEESEKTRTFHHTPVDTAKFLSLLRDEYGFKFLTHDWKTPDGRFTYDSVLEQAKEKFNEDTTTSKSGLKIAQSIYALLRGYIFGNNKGGRLTWLNVDSKKIDVSWSDKKVKDWCEKHAPHHPIEDNINGLKEKFIIPFKNVIELKNDGSFTDMIQKLLAKNAILETNGWKDIDIEGLDKIRVYTNVLAIKSGLDKIFRAVQERTNTEHKKKLTITLNRNKNLGRRTFDLVITHHNSKPNIEANPNDFLKNDMFSIWDTFFGLVDWKVEADFDNGSKRLNLLAEGVQKKEDIKKGKNEKNTPTPIFNEENSIELLGETVNGFRHIITFYQ